VNGFRAGPLVALCCGWFLVIVDATIVTIALNPLHQEFGSSIAGLQWVVDGYTVAFAAFLLCFGWLGDRWGGKRLYQAGLLVFVAASACCGLAPGLVALVAARVVQGVAAAALVPSSLSLLRDSYPDPARLARAVGVWATVGGVAGGLGPLLGGVLVGALGWRSLFLVNVPLGLAGALLVRRLVPDASPVAARDRFDWAGQVAAVVALVGITMAAVEVGRTGVTGGVVGIAAAVAFVLVERRTAGPMIPRAMLADRALVTPVGIGSLMNFGFYGQLFVITLYLQQVRHLSPLLTGIALLPQTGVIAVSSWAGGRLTGRIGPRRPMAIGMGVGAVGFLTLTAATAAIPYAWLMVPMAAAGFGIAFTMPAATTAVIDAAPAERAGIASGLLNTGRQVGGALGIAVLGTLYAAATFPTGFRLAMAVAGAAYLGGLALAVSHPRAREPVTAMARG